MLTLEERGTKVGRSWLLSAWPAFWKLLGERLTGRDPGAPVDVGVVALAGIVWAAGAGARGARRPGRSQDLRHDGPVGHAAGHYRCWATFIGDRDAQVTCAGHRGSRG